VRGAVACGGPPPNESALLCAETFLLSLDHDPSVHPPQGRICFLFRSRKISKSHRTTLHQNRRLASKRGRSPCGSVGSPVSPGRKLVDRPPRDISPALAYSVACFSTRIVCFEWRVHPIRD
jgi:hypothetical protein